MELTRRNLVAASAAAAAVAASGIVTGAQAEEAATNQAADIVIVGEGMGGLAAGLRAQENGIANITIVEASKWPGGGSSFSLGSVHANGMGNTAEKYMMNTRYQSTSDLAVKSFLAINDAISWIGTLGLPMEVTEAFTGDERDGSTTDDLASGHMMAEDGTSGLTGCINFFSKAEELFVGQGGTVLHQTAAYKIVTDEAGNIKGVACTDLASGKRFVIDTTQVVLACGGWQNDQEMKQRYLGHDAWQSACMGVPYNTGAGIKMASELGASLQGDFGHFAGLFVPALPAKNWMEDVENYETSEYTFEEGGKWWFWEEIIDAIPQKAILVNNEGLRFCDEGRSRHSFEPAIAQQTHATAHIICDDKTWQNWMNGVGWGLAPDRTPQDRMNTITSEKVGGAIFEADTLEELADKMNETGVATYALHKANFVKTIEEYNAAAEAGTGADLPVARVTNECAAIVEPPFHAIPIRNAIFAVFGGLAIDESAQVLDASRNPIPGLYATEPCAGGMMQEFYAGSIAHAAATGMWAADAIAAALQA